MTNVAKHSDGQGKPRPSQAAPAATHAPPTMSLRFDPAVEFTAGVNGETVLIGGSPLRLLRLRSRAREVVERWRAGEPLGDRPAEQRLARRLLAANIAYPRWPSPDSAVPGPAKGSRAVPAGTPTLADVTIVIPVYNRADQLAELLGSIGELRYRVAEVIVVDDGSTDHTAVVGRRAGARVISPTLSGLDANPSGPANGANPSDPANGANSANPAAARADQAAPRIGPSGPAAARNAGLAEVRTPFVAFIDSDCVAGPRWLDALLPHFADPLVALVAPRVASQSDPTPIGRYEAVRSPLDLGPGEALVRPVTRVAYVPSAALVARTDVSRAFGGFDESMPVGEDVDLVWSLTARGWWVRYEPSSVVHHGARTRLAEFAGRRYAYGTSAAALDLRHPGQVPSLIVSPWTAAAWACVATCTPGGAAVGAAIVVGSSAALPRKMAMLAHPREVGWKLALRGHLGAGRQLAVAIWRTYLPLALVAAIFSRRARVALAASIAPAHLDWRASRPDQGPAVYLGLRLLDDASYCAGVWSGCLRHRRIGPLMPRVQNWPGRRNPTEDARS